MPFPPTPGQFAADLAPDGVEIKFVTFWEQRKLFKDPPRLLLVHTNGASREGTVESASRWSEAAPHINTCPHYQVDRDGRARKMLPSDRRGLANATVDEFEDGHGDVQGWSLAIETADTGYLTDPTISAFTDIQAEVIATIIAFEQMVHGFPLQTPTEWFGAGVGSHTDPFGYPYWTIKRGKICPGSKKKLQVREVIVPRARQIAAAWSAPIPDPPEDDDVSRPYICRTANQNELRIGPGDGAAASVLRSREFLAFKANWSGNTMPVGRKYYHPLTGLAIDPADGWDAIPILTEEQADTYVGYPDYERTGRDEG